MIRKLTNILLLVSIAFISRMHAQEYIIPIDGVVTFITSQNIYVKFQSTKLINIGDTLFLNDSNLSNPCLIVTKKSSTSCVCTSINKCEFEKEDIVIFKSIKKVEVEPNKTEIDRINLAPEKESLETKLKTQQKAKSNVKKNTEKIRGRLSATSYSFKPQEKEASHRLMYRFSMNALNIKNSKFSAETYMNFRQKINSESPNSNTLRIYNLALKYDVDSTFTVTLGRKINNKASSLGAIDGLQSEKYLGNFYFGAIVGFRPDLIEFDFNPNLLEYGAYGGYTSKTKKIYSQTTIGLLEQKNLGKTDRRYTYFQHSSTISRRLNLFCSFELDLFNKFSSGTNPNLRLTNFYASARYRFNRKINVTVSYDSRKRIIFYESLKTDIERLLDDDEARQGIRFRLNIKAHKYILTGMALSRRFQFNQQNKSDNLNAFVSISKLPIGGRMSINYNLNNSIYLKSKIISIRHSRSMIKHKLNLDLYYRNVDYEYLTSETKVKQNYFGIGTTYRLNKKWMFNVAGEVSSRSGTENFRLNTKIINRF